MPRELLEALRDELPWTPGPPTAWRTDVRIVGLLEPSRCAMLEELKHLLLLPRSDRVRPIQAWRREWRQLTRGGRR